MHCTAEDDNIDVTHMKYLRDEKSDLSIIKY